MNSKYKGILLIVLSAFCFAFMNAFVKLSGDLPSIQKSFFRNFIAFLVALFMLWKNRKDFHFQKEGMGILLLRSIFGTLGILCNFYALDHLVLSDASMLNKMSPFFTVVFSWILLKEKLRPAQALAILTAFAGSLFIIKPSLDFSDFSASAAGLTGGICAGAAYAMVRILGQKGMNKTFIVLFFSGFSCLVTLPFLILDFHPMTWAQLLFLIGAGIAAAGGQFTITAAYCHAPAREISVYDYSQIIFATLLSLLFFRELPDGWSFLGYAVIIFAAVGMFWYNNYYLPKKTEQT
ncbi:MAG: DMT family transporter [Oscillospiraceae bacterium]|nr:DMT family transporter [Oscillospiraceae bacterium]